jgi:hypothetical protein
LGCQASAAADWGFAWNNHLPLLQFKHHSSQLGSSFQNGTSFFEVGIMPILCTKIKAGLNLLGRGKKTLHKLGDYSLFMRQWPQSPTEWCTE